MAFFLPKISSSPLLPHPCPSQNNPSRPFFSSSPLTNLEPPPVRDATREKPPALHGKPPAALHETKKKSEKNSDKDDFYLNLGLAVRTLRDDLPSLFSKDLNYGIYRDDITFIDPLNTFHGIENYKLIFWALRLHGRILFREIGLKIFRVWQLSESMILIRWELQGVPRVPWEARGRFQGTSRCLSFFLAVVDGGTNSFKFLVHAFTFGHLLTSTSTWRPSSLAVAMMPMATPPLLNSYALTAFHLSVTCTHAIVTSAFETAPTRISSLWLKVKFFTSEAVMNLALNDNAHDWDMANMYERGLGAAILSSSLNMAVSRAVDTRMNCKAYGQETASRQQMRHKDVILWLSLHGGNARSENLFCLVYHHPFAAGYESLAIFFSLRFH
ncbi:hypothetical protein COCNU_12G001100 [Cocos nucifera]|uniref:Uncharacterized protein n=1 Tax=Cocos nucifera TaxID=13894 RepID=A0A8K0IQQ1_COCNU|nr:hypothetical protein COCNU_12G001100 [Cocos nucifera]